MWCVFKLGSGTSNVLGHHHELAIVCKIHVAVLSLRAGVIGSSGASPAGAAWAHRTRSMFVH